MLTVVTMYDKAHAKEPEKIDKILSCTLSVGRRLAYHWPIRI